MSNKKSKGFHFSARVLAVILAALMVLSMITLTVMFIVDNIKTAKAEKEKQEKEAAAITVTVDKL